MASASHTSIAPPSPARLLWTTAVAIFVAEAGIMVAFSFLPKLPELGEALLDATLLITFTLPVLYLTWVRILKRTIDDHARARAVGDARALRDALTQLPNRLAFEDSTEREIGQAYKKGTSFTLVLLDVRRFHEINRVLGHKHGDALLCQIAQRLCAELPHSEFVTRLGSDLFGVLLHGVPLDRAREASARVHQVIEAPFPVAGTPIEIEGHCGIAVFPDHGNNANLLLQCAESALRRAKEQGERCQVYSPEDDSSAQRRIQLFGLLRSAIQQNELSLSYQPKVQLSTGKVVGVEALLSWRHPELGPISPAEFIPIAEQTSLIKPITTWVLAEAVRQAAAWEVEGIRTRISVNLSARNLVDESLPAQLAEQLAKWQVPPQRVMAEITESAVLSDPERAGGVLDKLCEMGVELSLDDFGTGYSSLTYLRTLPATELKIDRSFVSDIESNQSNQSIVRAVVALAHDLQLDVVAEGIESAQVMRKLAELGCDVVQGYFISRPLPAKDFAEFFKQNDGRLAQASLPTIKHRAPRQISLAPQPSLRMPLRESLRSLRAVAPAISIIRSDAP
ncbi:MAG TPA: EAL domain-containing protein [Polyangiaceae bacterium]|nr:EAL domain-containing protein [Polyangiaceae bacterium]